MAVSISATFIGSSLTGARVPFAAAREGLFFRSYAFVHPRFQTPSTALIAQAVLATLLLLAVGKFQALFSIAIFSEWLFYALTVSAVFVFRKRDRAAGKPRPYSVTGYPVVPLLFIAAALVLLVFSFHEQLRNSLIGTIVILSGIPLYYRFKNTASS